MIRQDKGFTLTEMLVATLLMSVVMTSVYTLFNSSLQTWRTTQDGFNAQHDAMNALTIMQREINNYASRADYLMQGTDDELTLFVVSEPMNVEEAEGRHMMRVTYEHDRNSKELVREEALAESPLPRYPGHGKDVNWKNPKFRDKEDFVVARNVRDFSVRYLWTILEPQPDRNLPPPPVERRYETRHKEKFGLPQAIEVTLVFEDPERRGLTETVTRTFPIRAPNRLHNQHSIKYLLEGN
jgi:prepilin-type N-terminal cleavage/methylation domain-containing protein